MTDDATSAAPTTPVTAALSESLHVLIDEPTRAACMGLAVLAAQAIGPNVRPREGESVRNLLEERIGDIKVQAPTLYARAMAAGRAELAGRAAIVAARKA